MEIRFIPLGYYTFTALLNFITCFFLALFVFFKNRYSNLNRVFSAFCFAIAQWSIFYFLWLSTKNIRLADFYLRTCMIGVICMPATFTHFVLILTRTTPKKFLLVSNYLITLGIVFTVYSPLYATKGGPFSVFPYWSLPGKLFPIHLVHFFINLLYSYFLISKALKHSEGLFRLQIRYVVLGTVIGFIGGWTNYLYWYRIPYFPPVLNITASIGVPFIAYAIIKYHLMDIKVVLTRAGIFAVVYILVLGLPFVVIKWLKPVLIPLLGENWWIAILVFGMALASAGPFIFLFLQRRAEDILLKEQRRYQQALRELSKTLTRIRDLDKLLKAIVLTVIEQVKVHFAAVYLKDEEYKSYRLKHYFPKKEQERFQEFIPLDDSLIRVLYEQKRPLSSEEIGPQDKISLDSGLVVPCFIAEGNLLGFLCLGHKPNNQMFTPDDLVVFETLSYSTSLAIENSQFWKEIEEHQRQARIQEMDLFSYSLAHEIDNPLSSIKTVVTYLKDYFLKELNLIPEKQKEMESALDSILGNQERVSGMVKAIEEFGKKTTGEFAPLRLEEVIKNYLELYLPQFKYHGISFTKEIPKEIPYIRGAKQELMQILVNFSNNSIHALLGTKEKRITLRVEIPNQDFVRLIFKDNGYGITEEKLRSIFAPFVTTKASTEGKGMGLYTIRRIVERHKGRVWAESEGKGKGATFFIELPIAKDVTEEDFKREDKGKRLF